MITPTTIMAKQIKADMSNVTRNSLPSSDVGSHIAININGRTMRDVANLPIVFCVSIFANVLKLIQITTFSRENFQSFSKYPYEAHYRKHIFPLLWLFILISFATPHDVGLYIDHVVFATHFCPLS